MQQTWEGPMSDWQARLLNTLAFFVWLTIGTLGLFMPLLYGIYGEVVR